MRPRFQADADFNHKIVVGLRRREPSVDFLSAHEGGVVGAPDTDVLRIAAESSRIPELAQAGAFLEKRR